MKQEQYQQAEAMYFNSDASKSEIAKMVGVSRRTINYWASMGEWDRLRKCAQVMPVFITENLYLVMNQVMKDLLHEDRLRPITAQEVNMLAKLGNTVKKLSSRNSLNESMELANHFMDYITISAPEAIDTVQPLIEGFIKTRAAIRPGKYYPKNVDENGRFIVPLQDETETEAQLDREDEQYWAENPPTAGSVGPQPDVLAPTQEQPQQAPAQAFQPHPEKPAASEQKPQGKPAITQLKLSKTDFPNLNRAQRRRLEKQNAKKTLKAA